MRYSNSENRKKVIIQITCVHRHKLCIGEKAKTAVSPRTYKHTKLDQQLPCRCIAQPAGRRAKFIGEIREPFGPAKSRRFVS